MSDEYMRVKSDGVARAEHNRQRRREEEAKAKWRAMAARKRSTPEYNASMGDFQAALTAACAALDALGAERDAAQRHIDEAGDGLNLLAVLDLYHNRAVEAEAKRERDEKLYKASRPSRRRGVMGTCWYLISPEHKRVLSTSKRAMEMIRWTGEGWIHVYAEGDILRLPVGVSSMHTRTFTPCLAAAANIWLMQFGGRGMYIEHDAGDLGMEWVGWPEDDVFELRDWLFGRPDVPWIRSVQDGEE